MHPIFPEVDDTKVKRTIYMRLLTLGHFWLYALVEEHGYSEFLREIIEYAICKNMALLNRK